MTSKITPMELMACITGSPIPQGATEHQLNNRLHHWQATAEKIPGEELSLWERMAVDNAFAILRHGLRGLDTEAMTVEPDFAGLTWQDAPAVARATTHPATTKDVIAYVIADDGHHVHAFSSVAELDARLAEQLTPAIDAVLKDPRHFPNL